MSISCAPTLESTPTLISLVPSWLGVLGTLPRWLFKKSCLWDINYLKAATGISCELIVMSCPRSLPVRVTEIGPKSRKHSIPSLETQKIMLFYCRLKVFKMRSNISFWLSASSNGVSTRLCHNWNTFCLIWL